MRRAGQLSLGPKSKDSWEKRAQEIFSLGIRPPVVDKERLSFHIQYWTEVVSQAETPRGQQNGHGETGRGGIFFSTTHPLLPFVHYLICR
jgi:hypothetical protein